MEECRSAFEILAGSLLVQERDFQEGLGVDGEENIKIDLKGIGINTRNWVDSAQDWDY